MKFRMGVTLIIQESEALPRFELFGSVQAALKRVRQLRTDDDFFGCAYLEGDKVLAKDASIEDLLFVDNRVEDAPLDVEPPPPSQIAVPPPAQVAAPPSLPALRPPVIPDRPPTATLSAQVDPFDVDAVTRAARESVNMMVTTQRKCSELVLKAGADAQAVVANAIRQSLETGRVAQANARKAVQDTIVSRAEMLSVLDTERALQVAQTARLHAHVKNEQEAAVVAETRGAAKTSSLQNVAARVWDYWGK